MQKLSVTIVLLLALVGSVCADPAEGGSDAERVGRIRAALLYYVAKFVDFPAGQRSEIKICLVGKDPLNEFLDDTVQGKAAHGIPLSVTVLEGMQSDISACSVLFLGAEVASNFSGDEVPESFKQRLKAGHEARMLTVCAVSSPVWNSCMIQVFEAENKARIAVDPELLAKYNFKASSELLEVALVKHN